MSEDKMMKVNLTHTSKFENKTKRQDCTVKLKNKREEATAEYGGLA